jgi:hypothetical protein
MVTRGVKAKIMRYPHRAESTGKSAEHKGFGTVMARPPIQFGLCNLGYLAGAKGFSMQTLNGEATYSPNKGIFR